MRMILLSAAFALGGCASEPVEQQSPGQPDEVTAPAAAGSVRSLAGEWRVAGIDGEDFNETYGIALSADEDEIWWEPRCAGIVRSYRIEGGAIGFGQRSPAPSTTPGPDGTPAPAPVVCTIGLPPRLAEVTRALDAAKQVRRTPHNGIELFGDGHSLTLFSQ